MLKIVYTTQMKQQVKLMKKRGKNLLKLENILDMIASGKSLDVKYKDHQLHGNFAGLRECHIESDWLLIYKISKDELILYATATGSHSDLFDL